MAAARRSEQRRLLSFVRMVDLMISDTLHTCLVASVSELLQATQPPSQPQDQGEAGASFPPVPVQQAPSPRRPVDGSSPKAAAVAPAGGVGAGAGALRGSQLQRMVSSRQAVGGLVPGRRVPLFVVEVVLEGEGEGLAFVPELDEFKVRGGG